MTVIIIISVSRGHPRKKETKKDIGRQKTPGRTGDWPDYYEFQGT